MEKISAGGSDQRCLRGEVAFGSDLASKRIFLYVENRERAFLGEKGVSRAQEARPDSWRVLGKHDDSSAGSQVECTGSRHAFGNLRCGYLS